VESPFTCDAKTNMWKFLMLNWIRSLLPLVWKKEDNTIPSLLKMVSCANLIKGHIRVSLENSLFRNRTSFHSTNRALNGSYLNNLLSLLSHFKAKKAAMSAVPRNKRYHRSCINSPHSQPQRRVPIHCSRVSIHSTVSEIPPWNDTNDTIPLDILD
jgi:hypothetical protein